MRLAIMVQETTLILTAAGGNDTIDAEIFDDLFGRHGFSFKRLPYEEFVGGGLADGIVGG